MRRGRGPWPGPAARPSRPDARQRSGRHRLSSSNAWARVPQTSAASRMPLGSSPAATGQRRLLCGSRPVCASAICDQEKPAAEHGAAHGVDQAMRRRRSSAAGRDAPGALSSAAKPARIERGPFACRRDVHIGSPPIPVTIHARALADQPFQRGQVADRGQPAPIVGGEAVDHDRAHHVEGGDQRDRQMQCLSGRRHLGSAARRRTEDGDREVDACEVVHGKRIERHHRHHERDDEQADDRHQRQFTQRVAAEACADVVADQDLADGEEQGRHAALRDVERGQ